MYYLLIGWRLFIVVAPEGFGVVGDSFAGVRKEGE